MWGWKGECGGGRVSVGCRGGRECGGRETAAVTSQNSRPHPLPCSNEDNAPPPDLRG